MAGELGIGLLFGLGSLVLAYISMHLDKEHIVLSILLKFGSLLGLVVGFELAGKFGETISASVGQATYVGYWLMLVVVWLTILYWVVYLLYTLLKGLKVRSENKYEMDDF